MPQCEICIRCFCYVIAAGAVCVEVYKGFSGGKKFLPAALKLIVASLENIFIFIYIKVLYAEIVYALMIIDLWEAEVTGNIIISNSSRFSLYDPFSKEILPRLVK